MTASKHCPRCQTTKPVADFYTSPSRPDGLNSYCKRCACAYKKAYYTGTGRSKIRANQSRYGLSDKGWARARRDHARKVANGAQRAYSAMIWAIKTGRLPHVRERVCLVCGQQAQAYYHPDGYSDPLNVRPYCQRHLPRKRS